MQLLLFTMPLLRYFAVNTLPPILIWPLSFPFQKLLQNMIKVHSFHIVLSIIDSKPTVQFIIQIFSGTHSDNLALSEIFPNNS